MSDVAIARVLRVGDVGQIAGGGPRYPDRKRAHGIRPVARDSYGKVAAIFMDVLKDSAYPAVSLDDIRSASKLRKFTRPRQVLAWLLREVLGQGASYPEIARFLCRADHTTILHSLNMAPGVMVEDPVLGAVASTVRERAALILTDSRQPKGPAES